MRYFPSSDIFVSLFSELLDEENKTKILERYILLNEQKHRMSSKNDAKNTDPPFTTKNIWSLK